MSIELPNIALQQKYIEKYNFRWEVRRKVSINIDKLIFEQEVTIPGR